MLLLSTSSLRGYGLHRIFHLARAAGYDGLDLRLTNGDYDASDPAYVSGLSRAYTFPVYSITAYESGMDEERLGRVMKLAITVGAKSVTFYPPSGSANWYDTYLTQIQARYPDILLSIVNMPPKTVMMVIPGYKNATLQNIKKVTGNTALCIYSVIPESGIDLLKTFSMLGNSIRMVYLADRGNGKDTIELLPGRGYMPIESLLIKMRESGYPWIFALAVHPSELGAGKDDNTVITTLKGMRDYLVKYFPDTPIVSSTDTAAEA